MYKCDACGGYHPEAECEIVTIKIIKGKACELKSPMVTPMVTREVVTPMSPITPTTPPPPKRNVIPPGIASMMIGPDHPDFEMRGAKERRTI